jgi:hypothetical protein
MFCFSYASMGGGFLLKREARETESWGKMFCFGGSN